MADELVIPDSSDPASELLFHAVLAIYDAVKEANEVQIQKENFKQFSIYLEKTSFILKALSKEDVHHLELDSLKNAINVLNQEVKIAKQLAYECQSKSKVFLLINCRNIANRLERCTKDISRAVSLIILPSVDVSSALSRQISELCQNMLDAEYQAAPADDEIIEKIELAIREGNSDRSCANQLLALIADNTGISTEHAAFKREFKELKVEMENARSRNDMAEALHMEQIIAFLEKADSITSVQEKEKKYFEKRNSLGRQPLEPLQSFFCPISLDVMVDPVETSTGKTFERKAIEKWLSDGNYNCPLTMLPLDTKILRPNKILRQSIQEWKDRNTIIAISSIKSILETNKEEEVLQSLDKLQELCMEREMHREWVKIENHIPVLVGLLGAKNREIRKRALLILSLLAKDNEGNKEDVAKVDNALESIVRSLSRHIDEGKLALELLLELSRSDEVCDLIGRVPRSILLLVTMLSSDDSEAEKNAYELLENLSFSDQNVKEMAKANYLKPLLESLRSGSEKIRIIMTKTLSEIALTDQNKLFILKEGVLEPLLQLLSNDDAEIKKVTIKALLQLSSLPENGLQMIREGVAGPLFELLYRHSLLPPDLREQVAATIMHLAISTIHQESGEEQISLLDSDEEIFKFFSLISLTPPDIQSMILRAFQSICQSPSGFIIRSRLGQISAVKVLVNLLELNDQTVRANSVKLLCCLTEGGDCSHFSSHASERCVQVLIAIVETSDEAEEAVAAMGIISRLPRDPHITQWLLDSRTLQTILACLTDRHRHASHRNQMIDNSVRALCHFTVSTDLEWQKNVAEEGFIPVLVHLLISGTPLSKQYAAISIMQLSESSYHLSRPIKKKGVFKCFSPRETGCPAHLGICTVESTFCILEANALEPLVRMLAEQDVATCEASLDALLTLLNRERLQSGSKVLADANAIAPMIRLLSLSALRLQEKTLIALELIFQLDVIKDKYKAMATMPLVDITQRKDGRLRSLAAKVLAQLGVLDKQSSYF